MNKDMKQHLFCNGLLACTVLPVIKIRDSFFALISLLRQDDFRIQANKANRVYTEQTLHHSSCGTKALELHSHDFIWQNEMCLIQTPMSKFHHFALISTERAEKR